MGRRGDTLREHILWAAIEVFLETGFERASMDAVAARAQTSKRSLYAHFESKEKLFKAFLEFKRELFLDNLKTPGAYSAKPAEAMTMYCARYLEVLLFDKSIRMLRVSLAETSRFPDGAALYFDMVFTQVCSRLRDYMHSEIGCTPRQSADAAERLLGQILFPRFQRALFGIDTLAASYPLHAVSPEFDLKPIRNAVADLIASLPKRKRSVRTQV